SWWPASPIWFKHPFRGFQIFETLGRFDQHHIPEIARLSLENPITVVITLPCSMI
ncbi:hypothetical protein HID58_022532, partial [Brassica napus]